MRRYEIDFLPVGSGKRCGDAIAVRYGTPGDYKVMVCDGGTKESGQALVKHVQEYYETDVVDYVVNTHPDGDHASGLSEVIRSLTVGQLWMHRPWQHSKLILDYFHDGRITSTSLAGRLQAKMGAAYALETLATERGIPIYEPFAGESIGAFTVLSPDKDWYVHDLICTFEKSPEEKKTVEAAALFRLFEKAIPWIGEAWGIETLRENVTTSAENESSAILFASIDGRGILLTGDAGVTALGKACDLVESVNLFQPNTLAFVQMPHHGSRNNVSPSVLNRILGNPKTYDDGAFSRTAFVSASQGSDTHPRRAVVNAFIRRGTKVYNTGGQGVRYNHNIVRAGWTAATPCSFADKVEDWN